MLYDQCSSIDLIQPDPAPGRAPVPRQFHLYSTVELLQYRVRYRLPGPEREARLPAGHGGLGRPPAVVTDPAPLPPTPPHL